MEVACPEGMPLGMPHIYQNNKRGSDDSEQESRSELAWRTHARTVVRSASRPLSSNLAGGSSTEAPTAGGANSIDYFR